MGGRRTNSTETIILAESESRNAEPGENSHTCDETDSRPIEHDLARSRSPTILSAVPDDTAQRLFVSKVLQAVEVDIRAKNDDISAGNKKVNEINQVLETVARDAERDLESKNAAIAKIREQYELNLRALNAERIKLSESRARAVEELNIIANERSTRMKLWEGYKGILDTLNGGPAA